MTARILLDTHALIWLARGDPMPRRAIEAMEEGSKREGLVVSVVSAWEIGLLEAGRPNRPGLDFRPDGKAWFQDAVRHCRASLVGLTADIAIDASRLPEPFHRDPADRLLVATARALDLTVATRDAAILAYAAAGHVRAMAC